MSNQRTCNSTENTQSQNQQICCPYVLEKFVEYLIQTEDLSFEKFNQTMLRKGFEYQLIGGDETHGTYCYSWKTPKFSVGITQCRCSFIHYLEDMCIKCNPDWYERLETQDIFLDDDSDGLPF